MLRLIVYQNESNFTSFSLQLLILRQIKCRYLNLTMAQSVEIVVLSEQNEY